MQKHYFELDKVESITLTHERETEWRWKPSIPARPKTFLGIKYGMEPEIPAGWNDSFDRNGNEKYPWQRKQTSYFEDYSWYKSSAFRIYNKAHVTVYLSYKHSLGVHFDSNEEAQAYVDDLILGSDKKFTVIINK
jgi:hypothetical protein